jgi:hypothetical protein
MPPLTGIPPHPTRAPGGCPNRAAPGVHHIVLHVVFQEPPGEKASGSAGRGEEPAGGVGAAAAAASSGGHAQKKRQPNRQWLVTNGFLVHNENRNSLDAHCSLHPETANGCKVDRTLRPFKSARSCGTLAQGRPAGFLLRWLELGSEVDAETHHRMCFPKKRTQSDTDLLSQAARADCRRRAVASGSFDGMFKLERSPRRGEEQEPEGTV